jgi:hypothetical protein
MMSSGELQISFPLSFVPKIHLMISYPETLTVKKLIKMRFLVFNKYKTFSVLVYSYINTSGNWENEKLCGNTTPGGWSVFTQFRVFPISTSVDINCISIRKKCFIFFYNIA